MIEPPKIVVRVRIGALAQFSQYAVLSTMDEVS